MAYISDKRIYVNADKSKVVPEDHPDVGHLLVGEGGEVSDEDVKKYGLKKSESKAEHAPAEDKAETGPRNATGSGLTINRAGDKK